MEITSGVTPSTISTKVVHESMREVSNSKTLDEVMIEDLKRIQEKIDNEIKIAEKINDLTGKGSRLNILA
jgi:hypothetical protein